MKILMFGWEFPPHISGGLGTACYGLTRALLKTDTELLFVVPRAYGDEEVDLIDASSIVMREFEPQEEDQQIPVIVSKGQFTKIEVLSSLIPYTDPLLEPELKPAILWNYEFVNQEKSKEIVRKTGKQYRFSGTYGPYLLEEVKRYGEVAATIAEQQSFDIIHAHDWLTYPAGMEAKRVSKKPMIVHVHATEFDRAGEENINTQVFDIERKGMEAADLVIAVSQWTKDIIVSKYAINESKVAVVHNGITPASVALDTSLPKISDKVITFLGRITWQKGPLYFVEAARKILDHSPNVHFIVAGSGDLLPEMMEKVAELKMSSRFHFTGFLKGRQIQQVWSVSDIYVMPSVSEPFGITPLEAVHAGVPVIVSNQSGVAEVMSHALKVDFWNTDALAGAIMNVLTHDALSATLKRNGKHELSSITWDRAVKKINTLYHEIEQTPFADAMS
jgi:glycogen synthase